MARSRAQQAAIAIHEKQAASGGKTPAKKSSAKKTATTKASASKAATKKAAAKKTATAKSSAGKSSSNKPAAKKAPAAKKPATAQKSAKKKSAKTPAKKSAAKRSQSGGSSPKRATKYGRNVGKRVGEELDAMKHGTLRSGSGAKVTNPKQAIAIALSEERRKGHKVPPNPNEPKRGR